MITYNNIVENLKAFSDNHFFLQNFDYGYELAEADLEKFENYPTLFSNYLGASYDDGVKVYSFELIVFDVPTDKDNKELRTRNVISDSEQCLEDLLADIKNGFNVFTRDDDYEVENASVSPVAFEGSNVYSGAILTVDIVVGYLYDSCNAPLTGVTPPPSSDCAAATYQNSDSSFSQEIASGSIFTSSDITVTQVDGSTSSVPSNTNVTCEWTTIRLQNTEEGDLVSITSFPTGSKFQVPDQDFAVRNAANDIVESFTDVPVGNDVTLANTTVDIKNQNDTVIESGATYANDGEIIIADTVLTDSNDDTYSTETARTIDLPNTTINSVSTVGGVMTINTPTAAVASGICYAPISPNSTSYATRTGDCYDHFINGSYDRTPPTYPEYFAEIDHDAVQSDVRATPATGTSATDSMASTMLKQNNAFGNKFRFTDDAGNASDATVGSNIWAHVDWNGHSWTGATSDYVIDHLFGVGISVSYLLDGSVYSLSANESHGQDWNAWIDYIDGLGTYLGYTGWRPLDLPFALASAFGAKTEPDAEWADNFFNGQRSDNRTGVMTGEVTNTNAYVIIRDNGTQEFTITSAQSGGDLGYTTDISNVFLVRNHY